MNERQRKFYEKHTYHLYHAYKNSEALLYFIPLTPIAFLIFGGHLGVIGLWGIYIFYCIYNNEKLNNDPNILKERESWENFKRYCEIQNALQKK